MLIELHSPYINNKSLIFNEGEIVISKFNNIYRIYTTQDGNFYYKNKFEIINELNKKGYSMDTKLLNLL